jgi:hypothetical protein
MSKDGSSGVDRAFFRAFAADAMSKVREMRGVRWFRLSEVHKRPDHVIAGV